MIKGVASSKQSTYECNEMLLEAIPRNTSASKIRAIRYLWNHIESHYNHRKCSNPRKIEEYLRKHTDFDGDILDTLTHQLHNYYHSLSEQNLTVQEQHSIWYGKISGQGQIWKGDDTIWWCTFASLEAIVGSTHVAIWSTHYDIRAIRLEYHRQWAHHQMGYCHQCTGCPRSTGCLTGQCMSRCGCKKRGKGKHCSIGCQCLNCGNNIENETHIYISGRRCGGRPIDRQRRGRHRRLGVRTKYREWQSNQSVRIRGWVRRRLYKLFGYCLLLVLKLCVVLLDMLKQVTNFFGNNESVPYLG